jgi:hypothetical protein
VRSPLKSNLHFPQFLVHFSGVLLVITVTVIGQYTRDINIWLGLNILFYCDRSVMNYRTISINFLVFLGSKGDLFLSPKSMILVLGWCVDLRRWKLGYQTQRWWHSTPGAVAEWTTVLLSEPRSLSNLAKHLKAKGDSEAGTWRLRWVTVWPLIGLVSAKHITHQEAIECTFYYGFDFLFHSFFNQFYHSFYGLNQVFFLTGFHHFLVTWFSWFLPLQFWDFLVLWVMDLWTHRMINPRIFSQEWDILL